MFVADYQRLAMHRLMLRDRVRNETFREGIGAAVTPGNVVLDVGAGTGILSLFCIQAGAQRVYAVERTGCWHNPFRKLLIRREKKAQNYLALVHLACCLIVYRLIVLG